METTRDLSLSFYDDYGIQSIYAKQFDTQRVIVFRCDENVVPASRDNFKVYARGKDINGVLISPFEIKSEDITDYTVTFHIPSYFLRTPGKIACDLLFVIGNIDIDTEGQVVIGDETQILSTHNFNIYVEAASTTGAILPPEEQEKIDTLTELIIEATELVEGHKYLERDGDTMNGDLDMNNGDITNIGRATAYEINAYDIGPYGDNPIRLSGADVEISSRLFVDNILPNSGNSISFEADEVEWDGNTVLTTGDIGDKVATLTDGKVPQSQLPSYVDDVLEYNSTSAFPVIGEAGKIYIAKDTNKTYRWSGSTYVEISQSLALGETSSSAYAGSKGKALADKLATIASGAEVNVQSDWNQNSTSADDYIKNKPDCVLKTDNTFNLTSTYKGNTDTTLYSFKGYIQDNQSNLTEFVAIKNYGGSTQYAGQGSIEVSKDIHSTSRNGLIVRDPYVNNKSVRETRYHDSGIQNLKATDAADNGLRITTCDGNIFIGIRPDDNYGDDKWIKLVSNLVQIESIDEYLYPNSSIFQVFGEIVSNKGFTANKSNYKSTYYENDRIHVKDSHRYQLTTCDGSIDFNNNKLTLEGDNGIKLDSNYIDIWASYEVNVNSADTYLNADNEIRLKPGSGVYIENDGDYSNESGSFKFSSNWDNAHNDTIFGLSAYQNGSQSQSEIFIIDNNGNVNISGQYRTNGSDYAELFETINDIEVPLSRFVTLDGKRIRLAQADDDYILGVTSTNPSIIGDRSNNGIPVGLLGKLIVEDDGTCEVNGYAGVLHNGIATKREKGYRVMERIDESHILILFR